MLSQPCIELLHFLLLHINSLLSHLLHLAVFSILELFLGHRDTDVPPLLSSSLI